MMKQKHVDASRELRLWIQLIIPILLIVAQPEVRSLVGDVTVKTKRSVKNKVKKLTKKLKKEEE